MNTTPGNKQATQTNELYDVIICGAGPVGLFLACELALAHCRVLVLEKAAQPDSVLKRVPFGIRGLSAPSIEALYRRGLLPELQLHKRLENPHLNAVAGARRQAGHFAGIPFHQEDVDATQWPYRMQSATATSLISELEELETVLCRRVAELGATTLRGITITGTEQAADHVTAHSAEGVFKARWLVGCDGARSMVRKKGGFEFAGTEPEFTGYTVMADIANPELLKQGRNVTAEGMYLQSQPGYLMIQDFDGGAFHNSEKPVTREHIEQVLRRISGTDVTINALHTATTWTDRARQATSYRNGRILLAGDAAHIHSPLGGQGLNLGLGDAMNLGWKLAATIHERAAEGLLDSYHTERHPVGAQVLDWSRAQVALMRTDPQTRALRSIFENLINTGDGATYIAGRVWGINTSYDLGGRHILTGRSAPGFELQDGRMTDELMQDGRGLLLDFRGDEKIKDIAAAYSGQLHYIAARAKEEAGLSAVLVRPDGIVAWAADDAPDYSGLQEAAARWFV